MTIVYNDNRITKRFIKKLIQLLYRTQLSLNTIALLDENNHRITNSLSR